MGTIADHFRKQGKREGKKEDAVGMLNAGIELGLIRKITHLSLKEIQALKKEGLKKK